MLRAPYLPHPKHVLERIAEHTQAGRWIKFTSLREIAAIRSTLKNYLYEAIELEKSGKKINLKKPSEHPIPGELQRMLDDNAILNVGFRNAHTRPEEVTHFLRLICKAGKNQSSAGGKVRTNDPEWPWVQ